MVRHAPQRSEQGGLPPRSRTPVTARCAAARSPPLTRPSARASQVIRVDLDSPCALLGLRSGDQIVKLEGKLLMVPVCERLQQKDVASKNTVQLEILRAPNRGSVVSAEL